GAGGDAAEDVLREWRRELRALRADIPAERFVVVRRAIILVPGDGVLRQAHVQVKAAVKRVAGQVRDGDGGGEVPSGGVHDNVVYGGGGDLEVAGQEPAGLERAEFNGRG